MKKILAIVICAAMLSAATPVFAQSDGSTSNIQPEETFTQVADATSNKKYFFDLNDGDIVVTASDFGMLTVQQQNNTTIFAVNEGVVIQQSTEFNIPHTITIDDSVKNGQSIILDNIHIDAHNQSPIVVESGANVTFILKGDNRVSASDYNAEKSIEHAAVSVEEGSTVTFCGDGSLYADAFGYGAAIGTNGYYRDGKSHGDNSKSSGTVNIMGSAHVTAKGGYGAGIGGGAINGSTCEQAAFDCGPVNIGENAVVTAIGSSFGGYSAGIGGGGCYTSTCNAKAGDGGLVTISGNAYVSAINNGNKKVPKDESSMGATIGGGGACAKTATAFAGDANQMIVKDSAVVNLHNWDNNACQFGGGGAKQKTCCSAYGGDGGSLFIEDYACVNFTRSASKPFGGGSGTRVGSDTVLTLQPTATINYV